MTHRSEVWYTIEDDGIWLMCFENDLLHWKINLGYFPSVDQIAETWADHLEDSI